MGLRIRADGENEERRMLGIGGVGRASFDEEFSGTLRIRNIVIPWNG